MSRIAIFILSVSPTFYAVVSGGLISATVNLLTGMLYSQPLSKLPCLIWASVFIFVAAIMVIYVGVRLEEIRSTAANIERRQAKIWGNIHLSWLVLASVLFVALGSFILIIGSRSNITGGASCQCF